MTAPTPVKGEVQTPRTDAKWHEVSEELPFTLAASDPLGGLGEIVPADFARQLERENAQLVELESRYADEIKGLAEDRKMLMEALKELSRVPCEQTFKARALLASLNSRP